MTQLDEPRLSLLVLAVDTAPPVLYEAKRFDHAERLTTAGSIGPWVTVNLSEGRSLVYGAGGAVVNRKAMTYLATLGPIVEVRGPAIITGLSPDNIIHALAGSHGTLTEITE